jgi:PAS domain S-box-containing protein
MKAPAVAELQRDETNEPSREEALAALHRLIHAPPPASDLAALSRRHAFGESPVTTTELRYQTLIEQIPAVVFTAALEGGLHEIYVNPQITTLLGYSQEEWIANPVLWYERLHPDDRHLLDEEFARGCLIGGPFKSECRFLARDGGIVWVHGEARLVTDQAGFPLFVQGVAFDITETKRGEEAATALLREKEASLREKETLLKEVHHRVKNNLQVTSSLLRLQEARIGDESARHALRTSQDRIQSMALVHEMLYRSEDLTRIDLREYIRTLAGHLLRSHAGGAAHVGLELDLDQAEVPIDVAIPCGLILNELVSNSLTHAFPANRLGTVRIGLHGIDASLELLVRDDGIGLPAGFDLDRTTSLGLQMVRTLTEQLDGQLEIRSDDGVRARVSFPQRDYSATPLR